VTSQRLCGVGNGLGSTHRGDERDCFCKSAIVDVSGYSQVGVGIFGLPPAEKGCQRRWHWGLMLSNGAAADRGRHDGGTCRRYGGLV
jgi:hypothetical protein